MLNKFERINLTIIVIALLLIIVCLIYVALPFKAFSIWKSKSKFEKIELNSSKNGEKLYLKKETWGNLFGDNQLRVISSDPRLKFKYNRETDFAFRGFSQIGYVFSNDTLYVYIGKKSKVPPSFNSKIKVIQIESKNQLIEDSIIEANNHKGKLNEF